MSSPNDTVYRRPVSFAALLFLAIGFALFFFLTRMATRHYHTFPRYGTAEAVPADAAWQATAKGRRAYLLGLQSKQEKQAASYGWVDRKAGVVQLPVERAMELTVQEYGARK